MTQKATEFTVYRKVVTMSLIDQRITDAIDYAKEVISDCCALEANIAAEVLVASPENMSVAVSFDKVNSGALYNGSRNLEALIKDEASVTFTDAAKIHHLAAELKRRFEDVERVGMALGLNIQVERDN